jgi:hypothetical protein
MSDNEGHEIFPRKRKNATVENFNKRMRGEKYVGRKKIDNILTKVEKPEKSIGEFHIL